MGDRIRQFKWGESPLGPPAAWPHALRLSLDMCLHSSFPIAIYWGADLRLIYNDGWSPIAGQRHPHALGQPAHEVWPDIWHIVGPQLHDVIASGQGYSTADQHLPMTRSGRLEESYWDYSFTPIIGDDGAVAGILNQGHEVTARVFERRRHGLLLALTDRLRSLDDGDAIVAEAIDTLGAHMDVARVGYGVVDLTAGTLRVVHSWRRDDSLSDVRGTYPLGAFGEDLHAAMKSGTIFSVDDARLDRRVAGTAAEDRYRALRIGAGLVVPVLKGGVYAAAIFAHDDQPRYWTTHHETLLADVAERIWQEDGRARSGLALRQTEARYRLIFEQANDIIFATDLHQTVTAANPAAGEALGVAAPSLIGRSIAEFISPEDFAAASERLRQKLTGAGTMRYEVPVLPGDGRTLRWEINSSLATDEGGRPTGLHAIARDVTERHAYEEDQRRLVNELNHRVKNMLALVQGLALQSFKGDKPLEEAQRSFQARLSALATAHDLLTRDKWEGGTLADIVVAALAASGGERERVSHEGPVVALPPKTAVSLIMALHEMKTNALRYGALSTDRGRIDIRWHHEPDGRLAIEWQESGGPPVLPPARRGFGLRMVERALATDLGATVRIDFAPDGLTCEIHASLPSAQGSRA